MRIFFRCMKARTKYTEMTRISLWRYYSLLKTKSLERECVIGRQENIRICTQN